MKRLKNLFPLAALLLASACASEPEQIPASGENNNNGNILKTCPLILNVSKTNFDPLTRADGDEDPADEESSWVEGDKIYLTFTNGSETTSGEAKFSNGVWSVSYYGELAYGSAAKCQALYVDYFTKPESDDYVEGNFLPLTPYDALYEDAGGQYLFNGTTLTVTADLKPKTGRMRFAGESGENIKVNGIATYSLYDRLNASFSKSSDNKIVLTVDKSGYTPYIYGEFINPEKPRMNIGLATTGFTRLLPSDIFKQGESGYISIPTPEEHNTWREALIFSLGDAEMVMLPVYNSSTEKLFYLAETELTEEQYAAFTPGVTTGKKSKLPKTMSSSGDYTTVLGNLNLATGLSFRVPSYAEWYFAFCGGNQTNPFTYSGSNDVNAVAWFAGNSEGKAHDVKKLQPNSLGFYDMSGNVCEICKYSSSYYYYYGGYYGSNSSGSTLAGINYDSSSSYISYTGYRFALDF